MLHAYVSKCDAGARKRLQGSLKFTKNEDGKLKNPSKKQFRSNSAAEDAFEPPIFRKLAIF